MKLVNDFINLNLIYVTFSKNVFRSVNCALFFYQTYYLQKSTSKLAPRLRILVRSKKFYTRKYF